MRFDNFSLWSYRMVQEAGVFREHLFPGHLTRKGTFDSRKKNRKEQSGLILMYGHPDGVCHELA